MKRKDLPTYKTVEYAAEGFFIQIPRYYEDKELFVKEKPFVDRPEVTDGVINFQVYYLDNGVEIPLTDFDSPIKLRVRYESISPARELLIYDNSFRNVQVFSIGSITNPLRDIPLHYQGRVGSVYLELTRIPPDPNVGWG